MARSIERCGRHRDQRHPVAIVARAYEAADDLRLMQGLQQELWALEGPSVLTHVGDLAWGTTMHLGREREWVRRLWLEGDRCVAWAWLRRPSSLDYEVHSAHMRGSLHDEVLSWLESHAEGEGPLSTFALEDDGDRLDVLAARGYSRPEDGTWYAYYVREVGEEHALPPLPQGFSFRTVDGERDLRERVDAHREVWAPSRVTEESYRNVMRVWPYRPDLDCVIAAPDGAFVAYALCWYDPLNRVGELEPVGTRPGHRRRGLGAAVCDYVIERLRRVGARWAIVYADGREESAPARKLYESVGFRRHARVVELRKAR
jgi:ribosomal protein S18 acetylase RimI-like enzyme